MDPKDEEAQEQEEETEKKADTYALFFPFHYKQDSSSSSNDGSSTASAPPSDFASKDVTAHTSTPYLRKSPQQTLQGTGTDHKCFAFCSNCSNTRHNSTHRCYAPTYVPRE
jgi:hypothetical protein